jgi:hypothetical protein
VTTLSLADLERIFYAGESDEKLAFFQAAANAGITAASLLQLEQFINASDLTLYSGAPALAVTGSSVAKSVAGWQLDAAAQESVGTIWKVPIGWKTLHLDVLWYNPGAGAGNVVFREDSAVFAEGASLDINAAGANTAAIAAPAQWVTKTTRLVSDLPVTEANFLRLQVTRVAADAGDTLGNDIGILGLKLTKVT